MGTNTEPANSRRAVRTSEARATGSAAPAGASASSMGMRPAGCSIVISAVAPGGVGPASLRGEAAGQHAGRGDADRAGRRDRAVAGARGEVADVERAAGSGGRDQDGLGDHHPADVAEAHQGTGLAADRLQAREKRDIGVELGWTLVPGLAEVRGAHDHHRHRHVDAGGIHTLDPIADTPGRQQLAGLGAGRIEEGEADRGGGARHAVDGRAALVGHGAARRLDDGLDQLAGIDVVDADLGLGRGGGDHPGLDRERPDAGQHVAAVGRGVDRRLQHAGLGEQIVDVRVRPGRAADDRDLRGKGMAAADTVDLQLVPRAHDARKYSIAQRRITRQIFTAEIRPARSTAPHQHARYCWHTQTFDTLVGILCRGRRPHHSDDIDSRSHSL